MADQGLFIWSIFSTWQADNHRHMIRLSDSKMNLEFPSGQPLVSSPDISSKYQKPYFVAAHAWILYHHETRRPFQYHIFSAEYHTSADNMLSIIQQESVLFIHELIWDMNTDVIWYGLNKTYYIAYVWEGTSQPCGGRHGLYHNRCTHFCLSTNYV